jgi:hypothetical protein
MRGFVGVELGGRFRVGWGAGEQRFVGCGAVYGARVIGDSRWNGHQERRIDGVRQG